MRKKPDDLIINLKELDKDLIKANSFYRVFIRGIFWGVGTALGATIVAAIVISLLSKIINSASDAPVLKDIMQNLQ
jgi:hypothetical protein